jgi:hypothetical protein
VLMSGDLGGGVPPPLTLIYRGLPPIKLLLLRAFLENLDFVTLYNIDKHRTNPLELYIIERPAASKLARDY